MIIFDAILILHVACGSIALFTSALAFLTLKGPRIHAKVGRAYALAMTGVGLTSIGLWLLGSSDFLLFIAFFSTYMVLVGWRLGRNRRGLVGLTDQLLIGLGLIGTLGLFFMAINIAFIQNSDSEQSPFFAVVPMVFAIICGALTYFQRISLNGGVAPRGKERIRLHGIFMGAGTISTVTAFSLTAIDGGIVIWLLPTAIGSPLIAYNLGGLRTDRVKVPEIKESE